MFPLVFLMTLIAALERPVATWPNVQRARRLADRPHLLVLAGYAALLLTAVASLFYLVQERRLKGETSPAAGWRSCLRWRRWTI